MFSGEMGGAVGWERVLAGVSRGNCIGWGLHGLRVVRSFFFPSSHLLESCHDGLRNSRWWRLGTDYGVLFSIKTNWATCKHNAPLMSINMLKSLLFSPHPSLPDIGNALPILIHTRLTPSHILDSLHAAPRRMVLDPRLTVPILDARSLTQRMRAAAVGVVFAV